MSNLKFECSVAVGLQIRQHVVDPVAGWPVGWLIGHEAGKGKYHIINAIRCMTYDSNRNPDIAKEASLLKVLLPAPLCVVGLYVSPDNVHWSGQNTSNTSDVEVLKFVNNITGLDSILSDINNIVTALVRVDKGGSSSVTYFIGDSSEGIDLPETEAAAKSLDDQFTAVHCRYSTQTDTSLGWAAAVQDARSALADSSPAVAVHVGSTKSPLFELCGTGDHRTPASSSAISSLITAENKKSGKGSAKEATCSMSIYNSMSDVGAGLPAAPKLTLTKGAPSLVRVTLHAVVYVAPDTLCGDIAKLLLEMLDGFLSALQYSPTPPSGRDVKVLPFKPVGYPHLFNVLYYIDPKEVDAAESYLQPQRKTMARRLGLPLDRPFLRSANCVSHPSDILGATSFDSARLSKHLHNVHEGLPPTGVKGGTQYIVQGVYAYYHYMQDNFDDNGWGCAYRSLMTICSWLQLQGYTSRTPPSHREIQQVLVDLEDKEPKFLGSKQWIGAFECNLVLNQLYGVTCKILSVNSGADLADKGRELAHHFSHHGTPIMVGGGVLAYTILGIDWNDATGEIKFLILDPHYVGPDNLKPIQKKWVHWHEPSLFRKDAFYNLCMPQRPNEC